MGKLAYVSLDIPYESKLDVVNQANSLKNIFADSKIVFDPMIEQNVHMTLAFMGEKLKNQQKKLIDNVLLQINSSNSELLDQLFKFEKYALFPESKKNLVVGIFSINSKIMAIIQQLKSNLQVLNVLSEDKDKNFVAHITMGKILSKDKHQFDWDKTLNDLEPLLDITSNGCVLIS